MNTHFFYSEPKHQSSHLSRKTVCITTIFGTERSRNEFSQVLLKRKRFVAAAAVINFFGKRMAVAFAFRNISISIPLRFFISLWKMTTCNEFPLLTSKSKGVHFGWFPMCRATTFLSRHTHKQFCTQRTNPAHKENGTRNRQDCKVLLYVHARRSI